VLKKVQYKISHAPARVFSQETHEHIRQKYGLFHSHSQRILEFHLALYTIPATIYHLSFSDPFFGCSFGWHSFFPCLPRRCISTGAGMYVCMCVCISMCMYDVCMYVCISMCMYVRFINVCIENVYACSVHTYASVLPGAGLHACVHRLMCVCS
jgi:hypothetical protein